MFIAGLDPLIPGTNDIAGGGDDQIREIKNALVDSFGGIDGLVKAGTAGVAATAAEMTALFDRVSALESAQGTGFIGELRMFRGNYEDIPAGWVCVNGLVTAFNLEGRFPIGADTTTGPPRFTGFGTGGTGGTGGETGPAVGITYAVGSHALTLAELPAGLPAALKVALATGGDGIQHNNSDKCAGSEGSSTAQSIVTGTGFNGAGHTHPVTGTLDHTHTMDAESLPPWGAVYFILYTGV